MMQSHFIQCLDLEMHVITWGDATSPAVVLWHGLTRTSRDFDELAQALSQHYYVICPDTIGRGYSQWSDNPRDDYRVERYAKHALALLDALEINTCDWVGTSMGGLIGMVLASGFVDKSSSKRIKRMVINDIGPEIPEPAMQRIQLYTGNMPVLENISDLEGLLREVYIPFGENTDAFWRRMALSSARRMSDGKITLHYDPQIALPFADYHGETLWNEWPLISCPTLIIRGEASDILLAEHAQRMLDENVYARLAVIENVAHAPTLASDKQINIVRDFLLTN